MLESERRVGERHASESDAISAGVTRMRDERQATSGYHGRLCQLIDLAICQVDRRALGRRRYLGTASGGVPSPVTRRRCIC